MTITLTPRTEPPNTPDRERRSLSATDCRMEWREEGDTLTLTGYACVFDVPYEMYGGPPWGWTEQFARGAFSKTLAEKPDVQLLLNHDGAPFARTRSGTLQLSQDDIGLAVDATLEPTDPDVAALAPKMRRRDLDEMSLGFRAIKQEWDEIYENRTLMEVSIHRGDVSVVNYGANPSTSAQLRALADLAGLEYLQPESVLAEMRAGGYTDPLDTLRRASETIERILASANPPPPPEPRGLDIVTARALAAALSL